MELDWEQISSSLLDFSQYSGHIHFLPWQSWFHSDGSVVFFTDIMLFKISIFTFSYFLSLCSVLFACVVFRLLLLFGSFPLECSCFPELGLSINVLGSCCLDFLFICWCISNISRLENQPFFIIVLTWSASLLFEISRFLLRFLSFISYTHFVWCCFIKSQRSSRLLSYLVHFLFCIWFVWLLRSLFVTWKKDCQHSPDV